MPLLVDTFYTEANPRLIAAGWVFTDVSRYDPTSIVGVTPSGKAFSFLAAGNNVSITVAGNTRNATVSKALWEPGDATVTRFLQVWNALPPGQR